MISTLSNIQQALEALRLQNAPDGAFFKVSFSGQLVCTRFENELNFLRVHEDYDNSTSPAGAYQAIKNRQIRSLHHCKQTESLVFKAGKSANLEGIEAQPLRGTLPSRKRNINWQTAPAEEGKPEQKKKTKS